MPVFYQFWLLHSSMWFQLYNFELYILFFCRSLSDARPIPSSCQKAAETDGPRTGQLEQRWVFPVGRSTCELTVTLDSKKNKRNAILFYSASGRLAASLQVCGNSWSRRCPWSCLHPPTSPAVPSTFCPRSAVMLTGTRQHISILLLLWKVCYHSEEEHQKPQDLAKGSALCSSGGFRYSLSSRLWVVVVSRCSLGSTLTHFILVSIPSINEHQAPGLLPRFNAPIERPRRANITSWEVRTVQRLHFCCSLALLPRMLQLVVYGGKHTHTHTLTRFHSNNTMVNITNLTAAQQDLISSWP